MGIGAAGGGVVAMAMVRDLFSGYAMVRMFSRMALVNGLAPILAPVIGSQLLLFTPWPGIFVFLAGYGTCVLIAAIFVVRETLPRELRGKSGMTARQRYGVLFADRIFVGLLMVGGMNFAGLFTYLSASPFLFQDVYGFSPQQYGLLFGVNSLGIVAGVQTSARLIRKVPPQWILACSTAWMFLMALLIVIFDQLGFGLWGVMVPLWFYILGAGFTFPCVQVLALAKHGAQAGTAASLLGAATFMMAGLISPVVGWLGVGSRHPDGRRPGRLHLPGRGRTMACGPAPDRARDPVARPSPGRTCPLLAPRTGHTGPMSTRQPQHWACPPVPAARRQAPREDMSTRWRPGLRIQGAYVHPPAPALGMSPGHCGACPPAPVPGTVRAIKLVCAPLAGSSAPPGHVAAV